MKYITILIAILFFSCDKTITSEGEQILTQKNNCWVLLNDNLSKKDSVDQNTYGCNRFLKNGEIQDLFIINGIEKKSFNFEIPDTKNNKWSLSKDGVLSFYHYNFKIIKISKDTILVKNLKSKKKQLLVNKIPIHVKK